MIQPLGSDCSRRGNPHIVPFNYQITISGASGVGTTTTLKKLQAIYGTMGWRYVSAGSMMREFASREGKTIEAFVEACRDGTLDGEHYDQMLHNRMREFARQNNTVLEGRLAHLYAPLAFHVLITCPLDVRAARRKRDTEHVSMAEMMRRIMDRDAADEARLNRMYPGWQWPEESFDFVFDTSVPVIHDSVGAAIVDAHSAWMHSRSSSKNDVITDYLPGWQ